MKILLSAYACEPDKGSEPEVGWSWARELARHHEVWVLTRERNRPAIEASLSRAASDGLNFLWVELPEWARFWKRGQRGVRLYYYLWQFAALRAARRAHRQIGFDRVHHVTFATAFVPALVCLLPVPFVWGPVGGGVSPPWRLAVEWGPRGVAYEILRAFRRFVGRYADPLVRLTWHRAETILVLNPETLAWLPPKHRRKALICPNALIEREDPPAPRRRTESEMVVVTASRLLHLKGMSLALRAVAAAARREVRLVVGGDGVERRRLERLAGNLGIADRVDFRGWLPRSDLLALFSQADVLLFPSLHEECGLVVLEAMARGTVPVVLDLGGPPLLVGDAGFVQPVRGVPRRALVHALASTIHSLVESPQELESGRVGVWRRAMEFAQPLTPDEQAREAPVSALTGIRWIEGTDRRVETEDV